MPALELPEGVGVMPLGMVDNARVLLLSDCTAVCDRCGRDADLRDNGICRLWTTRTFRDQGEPAYEWSFDTDVVPCEHIDAMFKRLVVALKRDERGRMYPEVAWRNRGLTSAAKWPQEGVDESVALLAQALVETTRGTRASLSGDLANAVAESAIRVLRSRGYVLQGEWMSRVEPARVKAKGQHARAIVEDGE